MRLCFFYIYSGIAAGLIGARYGGEVGWIAIFVLFAIDESIERHSKNSNLPRPPAP